MTTPCNASHMYKGGVACELDAGHTGLHRHGAVGGDHPVVYWSTDEDLCTRAELIAELHALSRQRYVASRSVASERCDARADAIVRTLYGDNEARQRVSKPARRGPAQNPAVAAIASEFRVLANNLNRRADRRRRTEMAAAPPAKKPRRM